MGDACDPDDDGDNFPDDEDCAPLDPNVFPGGQELCDGLDNDCNGHTDDGLCYDGNPCTKDLCDPETGCIYEPYAGPCDDDDACTIADKCVGGTCTGDPKNCDDGNPCTQDYCGPSQGCYSVNADGATCEDGNLCSGPDKCQAGACITGPPVSCDDGNFCTADSCDPAAGCLHDPLVMNGAACDDDDACSTASACQGGSCTATQEVNCQVPGCLFATCVDAFGSPSCICISP